jgi:hypothetical protein
MNSNESEYDSVTGICEYCNGSCDFVRGGNFLTNCATRSFTRNTLINKILHLRHQNLTLSVCSASHNIIYVISGRSRVPISEVSSSADVLTVLSSPFLHML